MNAHNIHQSGSSSPTNRANQCKSAKNSSTVSPGQRRHVTNLSNALNFSVVYAVMRACLICSASALCSLLSLLYTARAPPHSCSGRIRSTFSMVQSSQTNSTFSIHSTMGISVIVLLNFGISHPLYIRRNSLKNEEKQQSNTKEREVIRDWNSPPNNTVSNSLQYYSVRTPSSIVLSNPQVPRVFSQQQLPQRSLDYLLAALNEIWESSKFPDSWRVATIIPIPKPGKNSLSPSNYRPIALTSCLCKTMERMVNKRLVWFIESNNLYTNSQCGFRSQRSTMDHVVRLETSIREANIQRQHLIVVFFDLEKAYETTWRYGIMKDLHNMGLRGRLPNFIKAFLTDRKFQVRIRTTLSDIQQKKKGSLRGVYYQ